MRELINIKNRPKLTQETLKEGQKSCSVHKRTVTGVESGYDIIGKWLKSIRKFLHYFQY